MKARLLLLTALFCGLAWAVPAPAQTRLGVRGGVYLDQDEVFLGGHLAHQIERRLQFNPNLEYVLVERGSLFTINADFLYDLPSRSRTVFWVGGGLGISRFALEDFRNTDSGLNLLMGVSFGRGPATPFLHVKLMMTGESQLAVGGGFTF